MSKVPSRKYAYFFLLCFIVYASFFTARLFVNAITKNFGAILSNSAGPYIDVEKVIFSPFEGIIIEGISFQGEEETVISMDSLTLKYSFPLLFKRQLNFKKAIARGVRINKSFEPNLFSQDVLMHLVKKSLVSQQEDFAVIFDKTTLCFHDVELKVPSDENGEKAVYLDFCLLRDNHKVACSGVIDVRKAMSLDALYKGKIPANLKFIINFQQVDTDILVNQMNVVFGRYSASGSGFIRDITGNPIVDIRFHASPVPLKALAVWDSVMGSFVPIGGEMNIMGNFQGAFDQLSMNLELAMPSAIFKEADELLEISHLLCRLNYAFSKKVTNIQAFNFFVDNNLRIAGNGQVRGGAASDIVLKCHITPKKSSSQKGAISHQVFLSFYGRLEHGRLIGRSALTWKSPMRKYVLDLRDLAIGRNPYDKGKSHYLGSAGQLNFIEFLSSKTEPEELQRFEFSDVKVNMNMKGKKVTLKRVVMSGYGGRLLMTGWVHNRKDETNYILDGTFENLSFKKRKLFSPFYCELSGDFSGYLNFANEGKPHLKGLLIAEGFSLSKLDPLDKVAYFIGIKTIKEIDQSQLVVDFDLTDDASKIKKLDLDGRGVTIRSTFELNSQRWLEGMVALRLPRTTLEESKIFKKLIAMAKEYNEWLDFVVRLSGYEGALRIQLEESELRDKLKERVSPGIQRIIVNTINQAMSEDNSP